MRYNVKLKTEEEIKNLRESGKRLASALQKTAKEVRVGVTTKYLNDFFHNIVFC